MSGSSKETCNYPETFSIEDKEIMKGQMFMERK